MKNSDMLCISMKRKSEDTSVRKFAFETVLGGGERDRGLRRLRRPDTCRFAVVFNKPAN